MGLEHKAYFESGVPLLERAPNCGLFPKSITFAREGLTPRRSSLQPALGWQWGEHTHILKYVAGLQASFLERGSLTRLGLPH